MEDEKQVELHTLYWSARKRHYLAIDSQLAEPLEDYQRFILKLGNYWLHGHIRNDLGNVWFIADGGTWREDGIKLGSGLTIKHEGESCRLT